MRDFLLRPLIEASPDEGAAQLAGGPLCFRRMETLSFDRATRRLPLKTVAHEALAPFTAPRAPVLGVDLTEPRVMGVLNVTPDSFSDGGALGDAAAAVEKGLAMIDAGAAFLDIGGESTRPGADPVSPAEEQDRVLPVIEGLAGKGAALSIDTRNASTARVALAAGAGLFNDVSALTHDPESLSVAVETGATVCLMHAQGDPKTMQQNPSYRNVLIEVYAYLEERVAACVEAGIPREKIIVDPGIGFGKRIEHNVALISGLAALQGIGCAVLLGASRKKFIGTLSNEPVAADRMAGSVAAALVGAQQGAQILRVHDVKQTRQALDVWTRVSGLWNIPG